MVRSDWKIIHRGVEESPTYYNKKKGLSIAIGSKQLGHKQWRI